MRSISFTLWMILPINIKTDSIYPFAEDEQNFVSRVQDVVNIIICNLNNTVIHWELVITTTIPLILRLSSSCMPHKPTNKEMPKIFSFDYSKNAIVFHFHTHQSSSTTSIIIMPPSIAIIILLNHDLYTYFLLFLKSDLSG